LALSAFAIFLAVAPLATAEVTENAACNSTPASLCFGDAPSHVMFGGACDGPQTILEPGGFHCVVAARGRFVWLNATLCGPPPFGQPCNLPNPEP
jgi:hypothetical protein